MPAGAKHVYKFRGFPPRCGRPAPVPRWRSDRPSQKVIDTLLLLVAGSGHVLAKDEMMKQLWPDTFVEEGTLAQYIFV